MEKLFVYGTLMRKCRKNPWNEFLSESGKFISEFSIPGKIYLIECYPAFLPAVHSMVKGELWELEESFLQKLDTYEDYFPENRKDSLYLREKIEFQEHSFWIYRYNQEITKNHQEIPGGDFMTIV